MLLVFEENSVKGLELGVNLYKKRAFLKLSLYIYKLAYLALISSYF